MNRTFLIGTMLAMFAAGTAEAQVCTGGLELAATQISNLVTNRWACAQNGSDKWNEQHVGSGSSGVVLDWKKGPTDPKDPSDTTSHPTGNYSIITGPGRIIYTYPGGLTYTYTIRMNLGVNQPNPGHYSFCGVGGGAPSLDVLISTSHC